MDCNNDGRGRATGLAADARQPAARVVKPSDVLAKELPPNNMGHPANM